MRKICLLSIAFAALCACEKSPKPVPPPPSATAIQAPLEAPASEPAKTVVPAKTRAADMPPPQTPPAPVAKVEKPAPAQVRADKPADPPPPATPTPVLDLSLPPELSLVTPEIEGDEPLSLLPPLFEEKPETVSPFQISGRLINNEKADDYWDSIEGAELQFEFKR